MKPSLLLVAALFFAASAQAQHPSAHPQGGLTSQPSGQGNLSSAAWPGSGNTGAASTPLHYEAPRNHAVGYAKNEDRFVPSTFMNYDDALNLGRQQIAAAEKLAQSGGGPSLGEVARSYKIVKVSRLQASLIQGDSGKLEVCDLNGNNCRRR
jgi:hypothetical protein